MAKRIVRTRRDEALVDKQYSILAEKFRPRFGQPDDIDIAKRVAKVSNYKRLLDLNMEKKAESSYRRLLWENQSDAIKRFNYYYKKLENGTV